VDPRIDNGLRESEGFTLFFVSFKTALYITLFVLTIAMVVTVLVFWNIYIIDDYRTIKDLYEAVYGHENKVPIGSRWTVLILGSAFLAILITVLSIFFANVLRGNRFKQQQRDFANMMTHELRLPLSSIQVFAQTLQQRAVDPEAHERFLDGILSECSRLGLLIDQLLKLQKIDHGKLPLQRVPMDGARFLETFVAKWPRPLALRIDQPARIDADPMLLELAIANLVTNAEKYGRGSVPELILSHPKNEATISVRDGGRPIPKKYVKRIFKKFYRIPNPNTRRQNGVGLGLYIVKYIASMHKGTVKVTPMETPPGNEFSIHLPALKA